MNKKKTLIKFFVKLVFFSILLNTVAQSNPPVIYEITADKVEYKNKIINAKGNAIAWDNQNKKIESDNINYDKSKNIISTNGNSKYYDNDSNILQADVFYYNLKTKTLKANKNVKLIDKNKNIFLFDNFEYNEIKQQGFGNNTIAKFNDQSSVYSEKSVIDNSKGITKLFNAYYSTCKKTEDEKKQYCPTWSIKSEVVTHDKSKKIIYHHNSTLRIKNTPIMYSPYFNHPDPTVKRKSGFLPPLVKSISEVGKTLRAPYFWAIDQDKDLTITPIYYFKENPIMNLGYRQKFKNSYLKMEGSYSEGYKHLDKTGRTAGSRNYFFLNYDGLFDDLMMKKNEVNIKIQRISQENYVKVNRFNTELFKEDISNLENFFNIATYEGNKRLELKAGIYENIHTFDSSKYTYLYPSGNYSVNQLTFGKYTGNFNSAYEYKKSAKIEENGKIINNFDLNRDQFIFNNLGIGSTIKYNLTNINFYNNNTTTQKSGQKINNYFTLAINNELPLGKFNKSEFQTLTPKVFLKYTTGKMQNSRNDSKILELSDIYSMNRTNDNIKPETGASIGYGIDYSFSKQNINNFTYLRTDFGLGQVYRRNRMDNMPEQSSLNNSSSDIVGQLNIKINNEEKFDEKINNLNILEKFKNDFLNLSYKFNLGNNLSELNRNDIEVSFVKNSFFSKINFNENNNHIGNSRHVNYEASKLLDDNIYVSFSGTKNLKSNQSEHFNIGLNYENDCLKSSLMLSREFYNNKDLENSNMLIFSIILKPFGDDIAPDISDLVRM